MTYFTHTVQFLEKIGSSNPKMLCDVSETGSNQEQTIESVFEYMTEKSLVECYTNTDTYTCVLTTHHGKNTKHKTVVVVGTQNMMTTWLNFMLKQFFKNQDEEICFFLKISTHEHLDKQEHYTLSLNILKEQIK